MNKFSETLEKGQKSSTPVESLFRGLTPRESYEPNPLGGIHKIVGSYGGKVILHTPSPHPTEEVEEHSICYWNGITLSSTYTPKSKSFQNGSFNSQVYTSHGYWMDDLCMKEVIGFYQADEKRVDELVAENRLPYSFH